MKTAKESLRVELGERGYDILLGAGLLTQLGGACAERLRTGTRLLLVSDAQVAVHYLQAAEQSLRSAGFTVVTRVIPPGEPSKSAAELTGLWEAAVSAKLDRHGAVVALGGGVVGDLAGFAAASYLRGVALVQVPTSLLAMVDSAVGGKTGINLPQGKNLVGAFHQPALVLADPATLSTLPPREFAAGMAEVIKCGLIRDPDFFDWLEVESAAILALDPRALLRMVRRCCEIKAEVVAADEREGGLRAILNFGHTLGHAIENVCGYGDWLHGEAVAAGMVYAARLSETLCGFPSEQTQRLIRLLQTFSLPVAWPELDWAAVYEAMTVDKKSADARPRLVLANRIGAAGLPQKVDPALLAEVYDAR